MPSLPTSSDVPKCRISLTAWYNNFFIYFFSLGIVCKSILYIISIFTKYSVWNILYRKQEQVPLNCAPLSPALLRVIRVSCASNIPQGVEWSYKSRHTYRSHLHNYMPPSWGVVIILCVQQIYLFIKIKFEYNYKTYLNLLFTGMFLVRADDQSTCVF